MSIAVVGQDMASGRARIRDTSLASPNESERCPGYSFTTLRTLAASEGPPAGRIRDDDFAVVASYQSEPRGLFYIF